MKDSKFYECFWIENIGDDAYDGCEAENFEAAKNVCFVFFSTECKCNSDKSYECKLDETFENEPGKSFQWPVPYGEKIEYEKSVKHNHPNDSESAQKINLPEANLFFVIHTLEYIRSVARISPNSALFVHKTCVIFSIWYRLFLLK